MNATLKGLAWDHRRCWGPLEASIPAYVAMRPELTIRWDRQSLLDFGEGHLEGSVKAYDLVILDHPFIGEIARDGLLTPLDAYLTDGMRETFAAESVGKSWESYAAEGYQWALPIDAAAQVAAYRPDLLARYCDAPPRTHAEVVELGRYLRLEGKWLGLPLVPTDAMCLVLTFAAIAGYPIAASPERFLDENAVAEVVERVRELAALSHPDSWSWNPIRCYEHMISNDDVVYVPFAFGYVSYAARSTEPRLCFTDIPSTPPTGALLGGAGIGVTAFSRRPDEAAAYALYLCSPEFQRTSYVAAGGQPGALSAWTDAENNRATHNFFTDTLATLRGAYLRDRRAGVIPFFRDSGPKAAASFRGELSASELAAWFNQRHAETSGHAFEGSHA